MAPTATTVTKKVQLLPRTFQEYECKGTLKVLMIAASPLPNDKLRIFDSSEGRSFLKVCDKSKIRIRDSHVSYVQTEQTPSWYARNFFVNLLAYYDKTNKQDLTKIKIAFIGQAGFDAFKEDYINTHDVIEGCIVYLDEAHEKICVSWTSLSARALEIPYTIIPTPDDLVATSKQTALIESLDNLHTEVADLQTMTNAKYVSIPEFLDYLESVKQAYLDKKIKYVAFDIETNTVEWADPWSRICLISMADLNSQMAYSCAQYHPELWVSDLRNDFLLHLFNSLNALTLTKEVPEFTSAAKALLNEVNTFRKTTLVEHHEVVAYFEDEFFDALVDYLTSASKEKKAKKGEEDKINQLHQSVYQFAQDNADVVKQIKDNIKNTPTQLQNIKKLWVKLDEVLSMVPIVGQNIKFDVGFLYSKNIAKDKIHIVGDTLAEAVLLTNTLDEQGNKVEFDLESLYERETGKQNGWKSAFKASNRIKVTLLGTRYDNVELDRLGPYSAMDSYGTLELFELFKPKIEARIKQDGCNKIGTFLSEQYKAIEMFCSGECMMWSPLTKFTKILHETAITDTAQKLQDILQLNMVKKFLADNPDQETFKINTAGTKSHKAMILFDKRYFNFKPLLAGKSGAPSTDTDKVMKPLLNAIKDTLNNNLTTFTYKCTDRGLSEADKTFRHDVDDAYRDMLKEAKVFIEAILNYSMWQKLKTAYIDSRWDEENQQAIPYHADFKIVGATYSGRLSSGMHTLPQAGHIRDLYASIWNSESNRVLDLTHEIGETYNPTPGLVEVEYEDGTKEIKRYKDIIEGGQ